MYNLILVLWPKISWHYRYILIPLVQGPGSALPIPSQRTIILLLFFLYYYYYRSLKKCGPALINQVYCRCGCNAMAMNGCLFWMYVYNYERPNKKCQLCFCQMDQLIRWWQSNWGKLFWNARSNWGDAFKEKNEKSSVISSLHQLLTLILFTWVLNRGLFSCVICICAYNYQLCGCPSFVWFGKSSTPPCTV